MNKCKGCQWYGKPYWSIINPCDNCPRENTNIETITRWQDPYIEELQQRINKAIEYIKLSTKMQKVLEKEPLNELQVKKLLNILRGKNNE